MSDKRGLGGRNGRSKSSKPFESRGQHIRHLVKLPPHLARRKSSALPEILSVIIIGVVLTVFPWHIFRDEAQTLTDSSPWGATSAQSDTLSAPSAPCSNVATASAPATPPPSNGLTQAMPPPCQLERPKP